MSADMQEFEAAKTELQNLKEKHPEVNFFFLELALKDIETEVEAMEHAIDMEGLIVW